MLPKNPLWTIIVGLVLLNIVIVVYFLSPFNSIGASGEDQSSKEVVATIGKDQIQREEWLQQIEMLYGKDVLQNMVNEKVISQMAEKYNVSISDKELETEWRLQQAAYGTTGSTTNTTDELLKQQLKTSILLEDLLTKDVNISEQDLKKFYESNKSIYDIPETYHLSHIVVKTEKEAKTILKELKDGSSFHALAMERSLDEFSANKGGDLGYVSKDTETVDKQYITMAQNMKKNSWSKPIELKDGYAIIFLHKSMEGIQFNFKEIKPTLRRQLAIEQINTTASPEMFWKEMKVDWFYGEE